MSATAMQCTSLSAETQQAERAARMQALSQQGARQCASNTAGSIGPNPLRTFISADVWVSGAGSKPKAQSVVGRLGFQFDLNASFNYTIRKNPPGEFTVNYLA
ncbi:hypothetical protein GGX14DRAFT_402513 [Mycena pura]|uniref:Uncharacterized protein n=1 Tax=Mycena pura TaxID=153505 RepID=A0AAD6V593_9AGAR|nr:hypothetical protein GGX14DRAFT_402513 [Mycena pura]